MWKWMIIVDGIDVGLILLWGPDVFENKADDELVCIIFQL